MEPVSPALHQNRKIRAVELPGVGVGGSNCDEMSGSPAGALFPDRPAPCRTLLEIFCPTTALILFKLRVVLKK
jgi:hypothetical protein